MKTSLIVLLFLAFILAQNEAAPGKDKGSGGGGRSGGSSSMSSGISKLFGGGSKSGSGSKSGGSKSKLSSKLKKAAIIGVGAYGAYQVGKLAAKAATWPFRNAFSFNDWNSWREVDGMLCRNTNDCTWIDRQLYCQDYELDFSPSAAWFGGDVISIVGECSCPQGMIWDNRELTCQRPQIPVGLGIAAIAGIVIAILVMLCCCCGGIFLCRKLMSN